MRFKTDEEGTRYLDLDSIADDMLDNKQFMITRDSTISADDLYIILDKEYEAQAE